MMKKLFSLTTLYLTFICTAATAQNGNFEWVKGVGGSSAALGNAVAVDGMGNVYITGQFSNAVDFDSGTGSTILTSRGGTDIFLAKYDAGGNYLWAKNMGATSNDIGAAVAVDGSGNVYVTGQFRSDLIDPTIPAYFNPGGTGGELISSGGVDIFVAKYDANGNYLWAKNMGGSSTDEGLAIGVDSTGSVYVAGRFQSTSANFNIGGTGAGGTLAPVGGVRCIPS